MGGKKKANGFIVLRTSDFIMTTYDMTVCEHEKDADKLFEKIREDIKLNDKSQNVYKLKIVNSYINDN